jgi:hypothetical protein
LHGAHLDTATNKAAFSEGTPDLSGRAFNHAGSLPHECGVPVAVPSRAYLHGVTGFEDQKPVEVISPQRAF